MHHFAEKPQIQKSTWQPLIHIMLGFTGAADDPHFYQRDQLGRTQGDTALIELSSIASKDMSVPGDRDRYLSERISVIKRELRSNPVTCAVFYGTTYRDKYEQIAGGPFGELGFRWTGNTLCALITHPSRPTKTYSYWRAYGELLRRRVDIVCGTVRAAAIEKEQEP